MIYAIVVDSQNKYLEKELNTQFIEKYCFLGAGVEKVLEEFDEKIEVNDSQVVSICVGGNGVRNHSSEELFKNTNT